VSFQELQRLAENGDLLPDDMVQAEGSAEWKRADTVPQLVFPVVQKNKQDPQVAAFLADLKRKAGTPWATYTFFAISLGVYGLMLAAGVDPFTPQTVQLLAWGADNGPLVFAGQWWRPVTSMFVHIGLIHVALNLWVLSDIGPLVERLYGNGRFAALYVLAGVIASAASLLWHPNMVSAGASGAIFGVFGGLLAFLVRRPGAIPTAVLKHFSRSTLAFVGYNLVFGFMMSSVIDNAAHIGGLIGGFLCGLGLAPRGRDDQETAPIQPAAIESAPPSPAPIDPAQLAPAPAASPAASPRGLFAVAAVVIVVLATFYVFAGSGSLGTRVAFGKSEVYYKAPVTEAEVQKLGRVLQELGYFGDQSAATVALQKQGSTYQLRFVVNPRAFTEPEAEAAFRALGGRFKRDVFNNQPIEIHLCDELLTTKKVIEV
jgi:membrane associated rhomboid family serine protease